MGIINSVRHRNPSPNPNPNACAAFFNPGVTRLTERYIYITSEPYAYATSQKAARRLGQYSYFTGKPCPQGHYSERYAHSRECIACHRTGYAEKPRRAPGMGAGAS